MNLSLSIDIARRYLLGKKSTNAINIITWLSIGGLSIGTAALITILSVFNGFESVLITLFDAFNPEIKVSPVTGKYFTISDESLYKIQSINGVKAVSKTVEEVALFDYNGVKEVGIIKGVDEAYRMATNIDTSVRMGEFILDNDPIKEAIMGIGMASMLNVNHNDPISVVKVYMPTDKVSGMPNKNYKSLSFYPTGVFSAGSEADNQYMVTHLDYVLNLLQLEDEISYLEIKVKPGYDIEDVKSELGAILNEEEYAVKDRYEQDATFFKVMNTEKWVSFVIASFILFIIAFNLVGSLWMIVLEKKLDLSVLQAMGFTQKKIWNLIMTQGMLITFLGLVTGVIIAILIYMLQKTYGIVGIPESFVIDAYPIEIKAMDYVMVVATVLVIGFLASLLPSYRAAKITPYVRKEIG